MTHPVETINSQRNLVLVRAGDRSVHEMWLDGGEDRQFDLAVSYYGGEPGRWGTRADHYSAQAGPKWPCVATWLDDNWSWVSGYDYVAIPDDDLAATASVWNAVFRTMRQGGLDLAQPSFAEDSNWCHPITARRPDCDFRVTNFIENGLAVFSSRALRWCAPTFRLGASGVGSDYVWSTMVRRAGGRVGIIDSVCVHHVRAHHGAGAAHASPGALASVLPHPEMYDELMLMAAFGIANPYDPFVERTLSDRKIPLPAAPPAAEPGQPVSYVVVGSNSLQETAVTVSSMLASVGPGDEVIVVDASFDSHLRQSLGATIGSGQVKMICLPDDGLAESYDQVLRLASHPTVLVAASGWKLGSGIRRQIAGAAGHHLVAGTAPVGIIDREAIAAIGGMQALSRKVTTGFGKIGTGDLLEAAVDELTVAGWTVARLELDCVPSVDNAIGAEFTADPDTVGFGSPSIPAGAPTRTFPAELIQAVHSGVLDVAFAMADLVCEDQADQYDRLIATRWPQIHPLSIRKTSTWTHELSRAVIDGAYRTERLVHALRRRGALVEADVLLVARGLPA